MHLTSWTKKNRITVWPPPESRTFLENSFLYRSVISRRIPAGARENRRRPPLSPSHPPSPSYFRCVFHFSLVCGGTHTSCCVGLHYHFFRKVVPFEQKQQPNMTWTDWENGLVVVCDDSVGDRRLLEKLVPRGSESLGLSTNRRATGKNKGPHIGEGSVVRLYHENQFLHCRHLQ